MDFRRGLPALSASFGLVLCGAILVEAWRYGLWGLLTGAMLGAIWIGALAWNAAARPRGEWTLAPPTPAEGPNPLVLQALLDAVPTPLLVVEGESARVLNRSARTLFATDDRILPHPTELLEGEGRYLRHEGRRWRIDRVVAEGGSARMVAALIDIEQEERAAEARATGELIHILGHELLNGLAPIVSLAESGLAAAGQPDGDPQLLAEILGTLARRAEGLQRFTSAYRSLARLPEPTPAEVPLDLLAEDLSRLFAGQWPGVALSVDTPPDLIGTIDRDQISQAVWALLQNAAEAVAKRDPGRVTLRMRRLNSGLVIEVDDNGPGVAPQSAHQIFRPFHTTKAEGSGIGLSLARQIALAHGGMLTLQPAQSTTFRLFVPQP